MENIKVFEECGMLIGAHLDKDQALALAKALQKWLSVKAVMGTFDAGADMMLQDFSNEIEERARQMDSF